MNGPEHVIELFHGYTYSGHPLACAAALATLDIYRDEELFERARDAGAAIGRTPCIRSRACRTCIDIRNHRPGRRHRPRAAPGRRRHARLRGVRQVPSRSA